MAQLNGTTMTTAGAWYTVTLQDASRFAVNTSVKVTASWTGGSGKNYYVSYRRGSTTYETGTIAGKYRGVLVHSWEGTSQTSYSPPWTYFYVSRDQTMP